MGKDCRLKQSNTEQSKGQTLKCFICGEQGHISKFCEKQKPEIKFVGQRRKCCKINEAAPQSLVDEPKDE